MNIRQFKIAAGLPLTIKGFQGYSYQAIHNMITKDATSGLEQGAITKEQAKKLIAWRDKVLNSLKF
jgi:hypothetical protein